MEINKWDYLEDASSNKLSRILEIKNELDSNDFNTGLYGRPMSEEVESIITHFKGTLRNCRIKINSSNQIELDDILSNL